MGKEVQSRVPVGQEDHEHLRDNVGIAVTIPRDGYHGYAKVGFGKLDYRAKWIEFGHRLKGHKPKKKDLGFVGAQPMLRPGFDASKEQALEAFVRVAKEVIASVKKK
jgi:hypothetical protein